MGRLQRFLGDTVDRPWLPIVLLVSVSSLATAGHFNADWVLQLIGAPPETAESDESSSNEPPDVDPLQLSGSDAILVVECDEIFTPNGAAALRHVVQHLKSLDQVASILWMDEVPILNIFGLPKPLFPVATASTARFQTARARVLSHPLVVGQLLASDGNSLLMLINFDWLHVASDDDCMGVLRREAENAVSEYDVPMRFSVTGRVPMFITAMNAHERNQTKFQFIGYGMITLMAIILFRGVTAVFIVALAPSLGVFWTLGMLNYFDLADNPFNDVVLLVLLSLVGLTDGVHLMVQIRRYRAQGMNPRAAARAGVQVVGVACALTSLTTAIGFGSLSLAHHEIVREFGLCCVMGVGLTFLAVVTTIPLACSSWLGKRVHVGHEKGLIDRHLGRIGLLVDYVVPRNGRFSWIGIGLTALLFGMALGLQPDERNSNALPTHSEAAEALKRMDRAFGGLETANIELDWSAELAEDDGEVLVVLQEIDDLLSKEPLIGHPLSIRNLLDALPGEGSPESRMSMLELLPPPLTRAFYTPEDREATVMLRVQDLGIARYGPVFTRINEGLDAIAHAHPEFQFVLRGNAVWRWENLYQIVVDLAASLGSATVIIFFVLAVVYRSARIGLISIIPNMFPLALTGAYLYWTGQSLELVSVCAFTVCLGIAVDDTIHFLTRYREEQKRTDDDHEAIRKAFTGVGTALVMTTVVLVAGFATVLFSDSRDHRIFASMGGLTIAAALLGDLLFLPALLARWGGRNSDA